MRISVERAIAWPPGRHLLSAAHFAAHGEFILEVHRATKALPLDLSAILHSFTEWPVPGRQDENQHDRSKSRRDAVRGVPLNSTERITMDTPSTTTAEPVIQT